MARIVRRKVVDGRGRRRLRLGSVIRLRCRGVTLLRSLVGWLLRRSRLSSRGDSPHAHIIVPTSVIFPCPEIERHFHGVPDLILVQIRDLVVAERREAHIRRVVAVLIFEDKILLCP